MGNDCEINNQTTAVTRQLRVNSNRGAVCYKQGNAVMSWLVGELDNRWGQL
jgi:hypothetical protein